MAGRLMRLALRRTLSQVRYVTPVRPRDARGLVADVYEQVERDFGMLAPPTALHSPAPRALAASWMMLRESLVAGSVDRAAKESVAASVSAANECPYCVTVHSATFEGLSGDFGDVPVWSHPELMAVAVAFQYLNRMVNVFLGDSPLPSNAPTGAKRFLGNMMARDASRSYAPGESLDLLPPAAGEVPWASGVLGEAFARADTAVESTTIVTEPVRQLLAVELAEWDGSAPGVSRAWIDEAVSVLPAPEQPAGRLALLVAKASYQVDESVVSAYRATSPSDAALIELTAYASMAAARQAGERLWLEGAEAGR